MMDQLLVCTDLDRTLIPNGESPESPQARAYFRQFVADSRVTLVYVTGRHLELVEMAIAEYQLPTPNFIIADVGSSIYQRQKDQWLRWQAWDEYIGNEWQNKSAIALSPLIGELPGCQLQETVKQGLYKLSYYVDLDHSIEKLIKEIQVNLEKAGITANLIWSIDEAVNIGLLDILPKRANKYQAITFLMKFHQFSLESTLFAGDSGNDYDVLVSPIHSVLVNNANPELKKQISLEAKAANNLENLYLAQGDCLGMNGNYSAGILEGILHYYPECKNWLKLN